MISALIALNRKDSKSSVAPIKPATQAQQENNEKEEETKIEALPTGDSSNVCNTLSLPKEDGIEGVDASEQKDLNAFTKTKTVSPPEDRLITAIKTLAKPLSLDPLAKHDFDSFIVESYKRQRSSIVKKSVPIGAKGVFAEPEGLDTPRNLAGGSQKIASDQGKTGKPLKQVDFEMTDTD